MLHTFRNKSLNRILQELYISKKECEGIVVEFGAKEKFKKKFYQFYSN